MGKSAMALVPAAGRGLRMGGATPKQFLALAGLPLIVHTLRALAASEIVQSIILAVPEADREYCRHDIVARYGLAKVDDIVVGGTERQDSVRLALAAVDEATDIVLVHDAVRPFVTPDMIERVVEAAAAHGAAIVAVPMRDTVKHAGEDGLIDRTVDRASLWLAQTPQAFRREVLAEAHRHATADGFRATDDAQLVERLGRKVAIVEGSTENLKITRPEDLTIAEALLTARTHARL